MLKKVAQKEYVFFGEQHNSAISHWLQLELTKDLREKKDLVIGLEMFERDNEAALQQYLQGEIDYDGLDTLARLWPNYKTDYAPIINFAKDHKIACHSTNIPRRYASMIYNFGGFGALDSISAEEKSWIAPLPIPFDPDLPRYQNILTMMGGHGSPDLVKAQAIKDATMAHFILKHQKPNHTFLHLNGAYHSDFHEGIIWYLMQSNPEINYTTITTVEQKDINKLEDEFLQSADFIICVDEDVTKTY